MFGFRTESPRVLEFKLHYQSPQPDRSEKGGGALFVDPSDDRKVRPPLVLSASAMDRLLGPSGKGRKKGANFAVCHPESPNLREHKVQSLTPSFPTRQVVDRVLW